MDEVVSGDLSFLFWNWKSFWEMINADNISVYNDVCIH